MQVRAFRKKIKVIVTGDWTEAVGVFSLLHRVRPLDFEKIRSIVRGATDEKSWHGGFVQGAEFALGPSIQSTDLSRAWQERANHATRGGDIVRPENCEGIAHMAMEDRIGGGLIDKCRLKRCSVRHKQAPRVWRPFQSTPTGRKGVSRANPGGLR